MKRLAFLAVVGCLCDCVLSGTGRAESITYTETFTASGTLVSQSFTNAQITITGMEKNVPGVSGSRPRDWVER
jgi:hypothetical protein